jgi:hypothetical protein
MILAPSITVPFSQLSFSGSWGAIRCGGGTVGTGRHDLPSASAKAAIRPGKNI